MTTRERMPAERAARVLRAKAGELEAMVRDSVEVAVDIEPVQLAADIALVAGILADYIDQGISTVV